MHALLGENGAGKSTLMNILYGLYQPDEGEILIERQAGRDPLAEATRSTRGIGMVHQHFMLIPVMTVAENIVLAAEPTQGGRRPRHAPRPTSACASSPTFSFAIDPDARIEDISVGQQQRVEILKALYRSADILILDEPTAVLTPQEAIELFEILANLVARGHVDHLHQPQAQRGARDRRPHHGAAARQEDRHGRRAKARPRRASRGSWSGARCCSASRRRRRSPGEPLLEVEDLHVVDDRGLEAVRGVSFQVRAGEIVGIAGVDGNGQTELIDAITGLRTVERGHVSRSAAATSRTASAHAILDAGVGHIPEDRHRRGLVLDFTLAENIALHDYAQAAGLAGSAGCFPRPARSRCGTKLLAGVRRARRRPADARRGALGRQPAEGRHRARGRRATRAC